MNIIVHPNIHFLWCAKNKRRGGGVGHGSVAATDKRTVGARRPNRSLVARATPETHAPDSAAIAVSSSGRRSHKILGAFVDTLFSLLARRQQQ